MERKTALQRYTPLAAHGKSETTQIKDAIQAELRRIVMKRDGGCILRNLRCGHALNTPGIVFQAEHLIERSNSATYADPRLVVCICKNCHGWKHFKKSNHDRYDEMVKSIIEPERVALWDACEKDSWRPHRTSSTDWALELAYLRTL